MRQFISSGYQREVGSNPSASVMLSGRASAQTKNPVSRVMGSNLSWKLILFFRLKISNEWRSGAQCYKTSLMRESENLKTSEGFFSNLNSIL